MADTGFPEGYHIKNLDTSILPAFLEWRDRCIVDWKWKGAYYAWNEERYLNHMGSIVYKPEHNPVLYHNDEIVGFAAADILDTMPFLPKSADIIPPVMDPDHRDVGKNLLDYLMDKLVKANVDGFSAVCGKGTGNSVEFIRPHKFRARGDMFIEAYVEPEDLKLVYLPPIDDVVVFEEDDKQSLKENTEEDLLMLFNQVTSCHEDGELIFEFVKRGEYTEGWIRVVKVGEEYKIEFTFAKREIHDTVVGALLNKAFRELKERGIQKATLPRIMNHDFVEVLKRVGCVYEPLISYYVKE